VIPLSACLLAALHLVTGTLSLEDLDTLARCYPTSVIVVIQRGQQRQKPDRQDDKLEKEENAPYPSDPVGGVLSIDVQ
jgi:hypothetical protein